MRRSVLRRRVAFGLPLATVLLAPRFSTAADTSRVEAVSPKLERAMAIDLTGSGRDSIVVRAEDGDGFAIFVPERKDGYSLRLYPGAGKVVTGVSYADANHDGLVDLLAINRDGTVSPWLADGHGDFVPEPVAEPAMRHGAQLMMKQPTDVVPPMQAAGDDRPELRALAAREDVPSTRIDPVVLSLTNVSRLPAIVSAVATELDGDGSVDVASITSDGRLLVTTGGLPAERVEAGSLPAGFSPRLVVAGRFTEGGNPRLAVVGTGPRPRLLIAELRKVDAVTEGDRSSSGASLELVTRAVTVANATVTVLVASTGLSFSPDPVTIHVGDTVHWSWAGSIHTVTSGSACVADNKFCSPSDTSCATAPTSNAGATYDHTFAVAGTFPYFCRVHCGLGMVGSVVVQAPASPGAVPDGAAVPGAPLTLGKGTGGALALTWASSCSGGANDYAIYEGTLPIAGTYNHAAVSCTTGGATSANVVPGAGSRYYLAVAETAANEGSYGKNTIGGVAAEIPPGGGACHAQSLTSCP